MAENTDLVVLELGRVIQEHEKQISELLEMIQSLQRNLTNAFKETGYDFAKIARIESSRRMLAIQNDVDVEMHPEEFDPEKQDEIAKKILAGEPLTSNQDLIDIQRGAVTRASNKGRSE